MINKHKLYKIDLVSVAMILMLVNIVGAKPYNHDDRTCGCGDDSVCGCGATSITDLTTQSMNFLNFPVWNVQW